MGSAQMIGWASAVSARLWAIGGGLMLAWDGLQKRGASGGLTGSARSYPDYPQVHIRSIT